MSENKVNRPEDTVVSEMIKQLLQEKLYVKKYFQESFMEKVEAPSSWKIVKPMSSRKPRRETKEKSKRLQRNRVNGGDVKVVRMVCSSSSGKRGRNPKAGSNHTPEALTASFVNIFW